MFYHAFAGVPEWAPPHENHILYSNVVLKNVKYTLGQVKYTATADNGVEYLRLSFKPNRVTINGKEILSNTDLVPDTYLLKRLGKGDYALTINQSKACDVLISC
jgi:hypothetical protein